MDAFKIFVVLGLLPASAHETVVMHNFHRHIVLIKIVWLEGSEFNVSFQVEILQYSSKQEDHDGPISLTWVLSSTG